LLEIGRITRPLGIGNVNNFFKNKDGLFCTKPLSSKLLISILCLVNSFIIFEINKLEYHNMFFKLNSCIGTRVCRALKAIV